MEYKGCNNCKYQPGPLLTCDWLKTQTAMFMRCPRWEPREQQDKPQMTKEQAIDFLKMAAPVRALTREEFEKFIIAVNMAMDLLEGKTKETKIKVLKTNRDFTVAALQGEYDIGGVTEEAVIYNNINCPYVQGDQRAECEKIGKNIDWETCTECKKKWLDREPEW